MKTHSLSQEEADIISAILDEEEKNIDLYSNPHDSLTVLEKQCREIWPNWENNFTQTSPNYRMRTNYSYSANSRNFEEEGSDPIKSTVTETKRTEISPMKMSPKKSPKLPANTSMGTASMSFDAEDNFEFENMKKDIDSLFNRVQLMSSGSPSPKQEKTKTIENESFSNSRTPKSSPKPMYSMKIDDIEESPHSVSGEANADDIQKIKQENFVLKKELEKTKKLLEIERAQNKKLEDALGKSAKIIEHYKNQSK